MAFYEKQKRKQVTSGYKIKMSGLHHGLLVQNSWTSWRGFMFPDPGSAILSQHESAIVLDAAKGTSFFEVTVWGTLFYGAKIRVESEGTTGINLSAFLGWKLQQSAS